MQKMRDLSKWGLVGFAILAILVGLIAIGGPQTAREARRDAERLDDLDDIRRFVECVASATDGTVPDTLSGQAVCHWELRRHDPFNDVPYGYEKLTDTAYRLCAGFENPQRVKDRYDLPLDTETGCITWTYRP